MGQIEGPKFRLQPAGRRRTRPAETIGPIPDFEINNLEPARLEPAVSSGLGIVVSQESATLPKSDSATAHPLRTRETVGAEDASLPNFAEHPCQSRRAGIRRQGLRITIPRIFPSEFVCYTELLRRNAAPQVTQHSVYQAFTSPFDA
jgi:hypothetical protein